MLGYSGQGYLRIKSPGQIASGRSVGRGSSTVDAGLDGAPAVAAPTVQRDDLPDRPKSEVTLPKSKRIGFTRRSKITT